MNTVKLNWCTDKVETGAADLREDRREDGGLLHFDKWLWIGE